MISSSAALVRLLERYGVDTVFGIPGVHTIEFYRELPSTHIRHITPRHEQGAGFMADGYARVTGKPGVCFLITGPGVTNAATALAEAYSDSVPVLAISSVNQTSELGIGGGRLHELPSQRNLTSAFTVFSHTLLDPAEIPHVLARAFAVFSSGRPGPVHIEIPINLLTAPIPDQTLEICRIARPGPEPKRIEQAAELLAAAAQPLVILGGGAVDASSEATALVEVLQCPVVSTVAGKGVVDEYHPLSLGATLPFTPVQQMIEAADVVLAVGTEFAETDLLYTGRGPDIKGQLIRIDIEAEQLVRNFNPAVPILSDARLALSAINQALANKTLHPAVSDIPGNIQACKANINWPRRAARHQRVLDILAAVVPKQHTVVCDSTQLAYTGYHYYRCRRPRQWLFPLGFGTLGYGLPAALGAKLGNPENTVICLAGDGGYLFTVEELATAVEFTIPVTVIVWNNHGYGEIRDAMAESGIPQIGVTLKTPDFVAMAHAFGCHGEKPDSLAGLKQALLCSFEAQVPTVIEIEENASYLGGCPRGSMSKVKAHDYLQQLEPYLPGDFAVKGVTQIVKLSSNESLLGASPQVREALGMVYGQLQTYPDSQSTTLRKVIGQHYGLDPQRLVCESGSEQLINLLARAYAGPGDEVLYSQYGFIAYKLAAQSVGAIPVAAAEHNYNTDVDALLAKVSTKTRLLYLANPNNPTATSLPLAEIKRLRQNLPESVLLVLDAAYAEFNDPDNNYSDGSTLVNDDPGNVVVLHTFSKIYGLAALRLGWAYAPQDVCRVLNQLRGVFTVSTAAQVAGITALQDRAFTQSVADHTRQQRDWLRTALSKMDLHVLPSATNFLCVQFADSKAAQAADLALRQQGLIPRTLVEYDLGHCLRITIGLQQHNRRVAEILGGLSYKR